MKISAKGKIYSSEDYTRYSKAEQQKIKKARKVYRRRMFILFVIFICLLVWSWYMMNNRKQLLDQKVEEQIVLEDKLNTLQEEKESLHEELNKIQDSDYIEKLARQQFHVSQEDETIFLIPDEE